MSDVAIEQKLIEEYWYKKLSGATFPGTLYRVPETGRQQQRVSVVLPEEVVHVVSRLAGGGFLGEYVIYLSLFGFLTGKHFRENRLTIYSPDIDTDGTGADEKVRFFHSLDICADHDLQHYIREVSAEVERSIRNTCSDYGVLSNRFADRNIDEKLIHRIGFSYLPLQAPCAADAPVLWLLSLAQEHNRQLRATLYYDSYLVEPGGAADFLGRYLRLLLQLEAHLNIRIPLRQIELLETAERDQFFFQFNDKTVELPQKTLAALFEMQVEKEPERIALQYAEERLNYKELNVLANQLAHYLRNEYNVQPGDIIGMLLDRSLDVGIAALGILKAGAGFLPIDTQLPANRIKTIIRDACPGVIITQSAHLHQLEDYEGAVFVMDIQLSSLKTAVNNPLPVSIPGSLAYVLYTSGTTGKPKGAMIDQEAMVNLVAGLQAVFLPENTHLTMAVVAAYVFDPFWKQFFLALLEGHTLHIIPAETKLSAFSLWQYYSRYNIVLTDGTPSLLNILVNELPDPDMQLQMRYFMIGGESLSAGAVSKLYHYFRQRGKVIDVINEYGVTECCVDNICYLVDMSALKEGQPVPIGKPLPNNQVLILDADNRMVPVGCYGQIGILGKGVGRGYLNQQELTAERFIDSPYIGFTGRLYLTGDMGKWLPDGNIICSGRLDNQVKLNGYRIELGELEAVMQRLSGVRDVVALIRELDGRKAIAVYWTGAPHLDATTIKEALAQHLPEYMLPAYYCRLEQMPLTVNGKVDKHALPDPWMADNNGEDYLAPVTPMQKLLVDIWQQVTGIKRLGLRNDFFLNGGDSIKAIQIASQLHGLGYKMEVRDVFQYPTIEQLAPVIKKLERIPDQGVVTGMLPLTPVQKEFFATYTNKPSHYNQSVFLKYSYQLTPEKITALFTVLQAHHDALRITFKKDDNGAWAQVNHDTGMPLALQIFNWEDRDAEQDIFNEQANILQASIDLEEGPLMQLGLFRLKNASRLLIIVHHLVMDAVSFRILLEDLATLDKQYEQGLPLQLPAKTDAYKVWARELVDYAGSGECLKEMEYWQKQLQEINQLSIAGDDVAIHPPVHGQYTFELGHEETALLTGKANRSFNTEVQDLLITAAVMAYNETRGGNCIAMTLEGHGREHITGDINVSRTIGWFTSLYPVLFNMSGAESLADHIIAVKETIRAVPGKGLGYGIIKHLVAEVARKELDFDVHIPVIFNYLGHFNTEVTNDAFQIADEAYGRERSTADSSPYSMEITALIKEGSLHMGLSCKALREAPSFIQTFWSSVQHHLKDLIHYTSTREQAVLTPADLTYKNLSRQELEAICRQYNVQDIYPLSPMQEGILFSCLYNAGAPVYLQQVSYRLRSSKLDPALVSASVAQLAKRHDILRSVFLFEGLKRPMQVVLKEQQTVCLFKDLRNDKDKLACIQDFKEQDRGHLFNLRSDMLLRVAIFRLEEDLYEFVWTHHHLLMDAWCEELLIREYYAIYNSLSEGVDVDLPPAKPYREYIKWLEGQNKEMAKAHWEQYLFSLEKCVGLPIKIQNVAPGNSGVKNTLQLQLDAGITSALHTVAARYSVTVNTIFQAAWGLLLARYNNVNDVVFGNVVSGRPADIPGVDSIVGLFINTVPVRISFNEQSNFGQLLKVVQQQALENEPFHYIALAELQLLSGHQSLLDHILLFDNYPSTEQQLEDWAQHTQDGLPGIYDIHVFEKTHYDLNVRVIPGNRLLIRFDYNNGVYNRASLERVMAALEHLLRQIATDPEKLIGALDVLSPGERHSLIAMSKGQLVKPAITSVVEGFEEQVLRCPDAVALVYNGKQFTYKALQQKMMKMAAYLTDQHRPAKGQLIGIFMERSDLVMAAVLGILKAGAAFLPIDVTLPPERIDFLLKDADIRLLITTSDRLFALADCYNQELVAIDLLNLDTVTAEAVGRVYEPDSLAYVLYTSGSTGMPKGVGISMSSLVNYLCWANACYFNNSSGYCFGLFTSLSFDLSLTALFSGLLRGDKVVIFDSEVEVPELLRYLFEEQEDVNTLKITPSHVDLLGSLSLRRCAINTVILGGESVRESHIALLQSLNPAIRIYNEYGPTETTVGCTAKKINNVDDAWSIGKPGYNMEVCILSTSLQLQPVQAIGEIFIGGAGVASGYINRSTLTSERFINVLACNGEKMYRTGDIGRFTETGEIEYMGRLDDQLKVRGYRIEPAEVEKAVMSFSGIKAAVINAVTNKTGHNELVCYYTAEVPVSPQSIKQHLESKLPPYMIPVYFVQLEQMPLNNNGKIDRSVLPLPEKSYDQISQVYELPADTREEQLLGIWKDVLGLDKISVSDNFFMLGGNSLKIVRLYDLIQRAFNRQVRISELFDNPTIRQQAVLLAAGEGKLFENSVTVTVVDF
jgi:amino acid adenylation domain-containing protein/non-ribosomal peptide synthase protein (TIGR01720 family)